MSIIKSLTNRRTYYNIDKNHTGLRKRDRKENERDHRISAGCI